MMTVPYYRRFSNLLGCVLALSATLSHAEAAPAAAAGGSGASGTPTAGASDADAKIAALAGQIAIQYLKGNSDVSHLNGYQSIDTTTDFGKEVLADVNTLLEAQKMKVPEGLYASLLGIPSATPAAAPGTPPAASVPSGIAGLDKILDPALDKYVAKIAAAISARKLPPGAGEVPQPPPFKYISVKNKIELNREVDRELRLETSPVVQKGSAAEAYVENKVSAQLDPPPITPATKVTDAVVTQAGVPPAGLPSDAQAQLAALESTSTPGAAPSSTTPASPAAVAAPASTKTTGSTTTGVGGGSADSSTLASAKIQVGSNIKLVTATLFQGRSYFFNSTLNGEVTSSLPAAVPSEQTNTEYGDAEMETPDGGILNLRMGVLTTLADNKGIPFLRGNVFGDCKPADYLLPGSGVTLYGDRGQSYDRYYFAGGDTIDDGNDSALDIADGKILFYFRDGADLKTIYRGSNATLPSGAGNITPSSHTSDYGAAGGYYLGFGCDGGLFSQGQTLTGTSSPAGTFRAEALATWQYTDKDSVEALYPNAAHPKFTSAAAGGQCVINITNNLAFDVTVMWPLGGANRYMGTTLLGGFSISSNKAAPTATGGTQ